MGSSLIAKMAWGQPPARKIDHSLFREADNAISPYPKNPFLPLGHPQTQPHEPVEEELAWAGGWLALLTHSDFRGGLGGVDCEQEAGERLRPTRDGGWGTAIFLLGLGSCIFPSS